MDLRKAELYLRRDDKALRLRESLEGRNILLERKTKRGVIGSIGPGGLVWRPDSGRRREEGHVLVMSIEREDFDPRRLRQALQRADTWKNPDWIRDLERRDDQKKSQRVKTRKDTIRYKASELYDRYSWKMGERVSVPHDIR
jgi:hypothetical protein